MTVSNVSRASTPQVSTIAASDAARAAGSAPADLLPLPASAGDDLMTSIALVGIKGKQNDRVAADQQRAAAEKTQEEAQARKIERMRELAKDTFMQGLLEGLMEGAGAVATAISAVDEFRSGTDGARATELGPGAEATLLGKHSRSLARDAKLLDAASKGLSASSHLGSAVARAAQEDDRKDIAIADRDLDRAKGGVEAASTASRRADDDIRETLNNIRQYLAAKSQLANAAIIKG